jgi:hypothetical protein
VRPFDLKPATLANVIRSGERPVGLLLEAHYLYYYGSTSFFVPLVVKGPGGGELCRGAKTEAMTRQVGFTGELLVTGPLADQQLDAFDSMMTRACRTAVTNAVQVLAGEDDLRRWGHPYPSGRAPVELVRAFSDRRLRPVTPDVPGYALVLKVDEREVLLPPKVLDASGQTIRGAEGAKLARHLGWPAHPSATAETDEQLRTIDLLVAKAIRQCRTDGIPVLAGVDDLKIWEPSSPSLGRTTTNDR